MGIACPLSILVFRLVLLQLDVTVDTQIKAAHDFVQKAVGTEGQSYCCLYF
jgi:hypothetical protein